MVFVLLNIMVITQVIYTSNGIPNIAIGQPITQSSEGNQTGISDLDGLSFVGEFKKQLQNLVSSHLSLFAISLSPKIAKKLNEVLRPQGVLLMLWNAAKGDDTSAQMISGSLNVRSSVMQLHDLQQYLNEWTERWRFTGRLWVS